MGRKTAVAEIDEKLNRFLRKKEQIKSQIKRFSKFLSNVVDESQVAELSVRVSNVEPLYQEFIDVILDIETIDSDRISSELEKEEFEESYFKIISKAKQLIASLTHPAPVPIQPLVSNSIGSCSGALNVAKLPNLGLPKFKGDYDKWTQFYETFETLVHNNPQLDEIQKFYYLLDSLEGNARRVLDCLEITRGNYVGALDLLKQRFYNKPIIIQTHLRALFDAPVIQKETHYLLRGLVDLVTKHVRALKTLGEPVESWDRLIIFFISRKLDINSKKQWEEKTVSVFQGNPTLSDFLDFVSSKCRVLESVNIDKAPTPTGLPPKPAHRSLAVIEKENECASWRANVKCEICKGTHFVYTCEKLKAMSVPERIEQVKKLKLCMNCLRSSHFVKDCRSDGCKRCRQRHNTLLHLGGEDVRRSNNDRRELVVKEQEQKTVANACMDTSQNHYIDSSVVATSCNPRCNIKENLQIILSTAIIGIKDINGNFVECRALLDSGSQINFITSELAHKLGLKIEKTNVPITGVGQKVSQILHQTHTTIKSRHNGFNVNIPLLIMDNVTANIPVNTFSIETLDIPINLKLADPNFNRSSKIDILIGASLFFELICVGQIKLGRNKPILQKSVFGWIVSGPLVQGNNENSSSSFCHFVMQDDIQGQLEKFWSLEECSLTKLYSSEERECEESFVNSVVRVSSGKFKVALPIKNNVNDLGDSLRNAEKRFYSLENKLSKNPELKTKYSAFMDEYLSLGHMSELNKSEINTSNKVYYLPHHGVINESSLTTKLRVVFDASAKTSSNISLNDVLKVGPTVQDELFEILIRFRQNNVVITADIEKMYRQVEILPEYRDLQRILWRFDPKSELKHFRLNTVTYGTGPASFLATRCLKQISLDLKERMPDISKIIDRNFYVDDLIVTLPTEEEAVYVAQTLTSELSKYGFPLRKWASNKSEVMQRLSQTQVEDHKYFVTDNEVRKTLGLYWSAKSDIFEFIVRIKPSDRNSVTKRFILSVTSQIFDPLGLVGPVTVKAKVMLQKLWQLNLGWDETIPLDLFTSWNNLYTQLESLNNIQIPRQCIIENATYYELHGFSDASEVSYGACVYLRSINESGILVRLICAKSRVAPLKSVSLPRLELCGAVLLARLVDKVVSALDINISKTFLWSDSTVTLAWLAEEPSTWRVFVANRVSEVQELCKNAQWNHVRSSDNPADIISRGVNPNQLKTLDLWWNGPDWLQRPDECWPKNKIDKPQSVPEKRKAKLSCVAVSDVRADTSIFEVFSSLFKLKRGVAMCFRFYRNFKRKRNERVYGRISACELNESYDRLIKLAQDQEFSSELNSLKNRSIVPKDSKIKSLDPFIDEDEFLRVGGRLQYSDQPYNFKHPILLPKKHPLTKLIIRDEHHRQLHVGPQSLLAKLRQQFWIINGRNEVRSELSKCITCFRSGPIMLTQKMGNMPRDRVTYQRPFAVCGVDYAGPFNIKDGKLRNRSIIKGYMCIFVCFVTKAVHIELVGDLSSSSFLNCLKRFVSRRGLCSKIYSDNGTNFVGANNELKNLYETLVKFERDEKVIDYCAQQGIDWQYIPPRSPHQGGLWESAVKSAKRILTRVIGSTNLTFEELSTVLSQVESVLNSRPLTPLSSNPNDYQALTPGHFLVGGPLNAVPQRDVTTIPSNRLDKYHQLQQMLQHIWTRWSLEYLTTLQDRRKWHASQPNLKEGDMVLLKEENLPPLMWKLGRVVEVHPGRDKLTRVVSVRTPQGVLKRAVQKLCRLPLDQN